MDFYRAFGLWSACTNGFGGNDLLKFAELRAQLYTKSGCVQNKSNTAPLRPPAFRHGTAGGRGHDEFILRPQANPGLPAWDIGCAMHDVPQKQGPAEITLPR